MSQRYNSNVDFSETQTNADRGIFVGGGGGGGGEGGSISLTKKSSGDFFSSFSPQLILQKSNGQFLRNLLFFKVPEGVQHFPGGPTFSGGGGGSNCLFPIETHITCDFPCRGVRTPLLIPYRNPYNL